MTDINIIPSFLIMSSGTRQLNPKNVHNEFMPTIPPRVLPEEFALRCNRLEAAHFDDQKAAANEILASPRLCLIGRLALLPRAPVYRLSGKGVVDAIMIKHEELEGAQTGPVARSKQRQ
ncbi:MAG: hypothetical protein HKN60_02530 [Rhizobiales bacterium]|nr:hypothetical protein [Hyphomicrobiales bacterium]